MLMCKGRYTSKGLELYRGYVEGRTYDIDEVDNLEEKLENLERAGFHNDGKGVYTHASGDVLRRGKSKLTLTNEKIGKVCINTPFALISLWILNSFSSERNP